MTRDEAMRVLLLYRPSSPDAEDPETTQALALAKTDPELGRWFTEHCAFQIAMREGLRKVKVPANLRDQILAGRKIVRPVAFWRNPQTLAAAAMLLVLLSLAVFWVKKSSDPARFENFQLRMVSTALREYRMDIVTNDMAQVRQYMASRGAPADYEVAPGLGKLELTGGGFLRWRSHPVAMVCFNRGDNQMLYLFVMNRAALKDPPPANPQISRSNDVVSVSWTKGDKTYMLAGPNEPEFLRKYL